MSSIRGSTDTRYVFDLKAEFPHASAFVADRLSKAISDRRNALLPPEYRSPIQVEQELDDGLRSRLKKGQQRENEADRILSRILEDVKSVLSATSDLTAPCTEGSDTSSTSSASSSTFAASASPGITQVTYASPGHLQQAEIKDCGICYQEVSYVSTSQLRYVHTLTVT